MSDGGSGTTCAGCRVRLGLLAGGAGGSWGSDGARAWAAWRDRAQVAIEDTELVCQEALTTSHALYTKSSILQGPWAGLTRTRGEAAVTSFVIHPCYELSQLVARLLSPSTRQLIVTRIGL